MDVLTTVGIGALAAGLAAGFAFLFLASRELRTKAEPEMLRFGTGGALFMLVWFMFSGGGASAQAEIATGIIALAPLVAGIVLWVARRRGVSK